MRLSLTWNVRVTGSACGETVRTRAFAVTEGSSASAMVIVASGGAARRTWAGTSNTASRPSCPRDGEDRLSRLHDLARLGGSRGDRPLDVGLELGEANPILSDVELRGRVVDPRLRRLQRLLRRIEDRPRGEAPLHQVVLAVEIVLRLDLLGLRRR